MTAKLLHAAGAAAALAAKVVRLVVSPPCSGFPLPRFANPRERCGDVTAACAVHSAALAANIIEGDSRVLFYPAEPAPNANARRGDGGEFICHGCCLGAAGDEIDRAHPLSQSPL